MSFLFPTPEYESSSLPRGAKIFTLIVALLSILIIGSTIILNRKTLTTEDIIVMIAPFIIFYLAWLMVKYMRKETGVKWVPWFP